MGQTAAKTGIMPTVLVAVEQSFPKGERIIDDPWALRMLQSGPRMLVRLLGWRWIRDWLITRAEKSDSGMWGGLLCRKRYIDEKVMASRAEIDALVSLGAGFDTRSLRLSALSDLPIWEIDQRGNIAAKNDRLRKSLGAIPANIRLVAVDFDRDDLNAMLASAGYSTARRTFFVWEGVTQYLTEAGVKATFAWLARAAPGSLLAFTYVRRSFLTGEIMYGWRNGYKRFVETGIWLFGMEPEDCPALLNNFGWRLIEDIAYDKLAREYIRPTGRPLAATQVERIVYAEKVDP